MAKSKKMQVAEVIRTLKKLNKKFLFFYLENEIYTGGFPPDIGARKESENKNYTKEEFQDIEKTGLYDIIVFNVIIPPLNKELLEKGTK